MLLKFQSLYRQLQICLSFCLPRITQALSPSASPEVSEDEEEDEVEQSPSASRKKSSPTKVWSLTQFHSVAFLQFEDKRKIVLFTSTIKVRVSCFRQCPGATQEATFRALEGRRINYKTDILGRFFSDDFSAIPSSKYEIHFI